MYALWNYLEKAKEFRWVDLTHTLDNQSPAWSGIERSNIELGKVCFDYGNDPVECQIQTFKFPGQFGTHIDFPGHFIKNYPLSESVSIEQLVLPLCIIDITEKVKENSRYAVTVNDLIAYEEQYGKIPANSFVALETGWSKKWPNYNELVGLDEQGRANSPGWSLEALEFLYQERNIAANGHETLDTDASCIVEEHGDLVCERYVLKLKKFQVEVLNNLDQVAKAGAIIFISFPNIFGATGLPVRAFAITP